MNMLKVSIITTVLNGAGTIRDCIKSVQSQTLPVEHIIIDGGSTDSTLEIIEEYKSDIARVISEPDNGIYDAMNKGLQFVSGDVVGILNADDFYAGSTVLEKVADVFADKKVDSCYGDLVYVREKRRPKVKGKRIKVKDKTQNSRVESDWKDKVEFEVVRYWKSGDYKPKKFYWGWMPPHPTFFVRRTAYERHGLFNLNLGSAADYELMLRFLVKYRVTTTYIPEVLVKMRTGGTSNLTFKNRLRANFNDRLAWKVNGIKPYPWTLWMKPLRKVGQYFSKL